MQEVLRYYTQPGPMTAVHDDAATRDLLVDLPDDVPGIIAALRESLMHPTTAPQVGITITDERRVEINAHTATEIMHHIHRTNPAPLTVPRPLEQRMLGTCRNYTTLAVALLRHKGIPARARCGFGDYLPLEPQYVDHWVSEIWRADEGRWARADEELGPYAQEFMKIDFDVFDVPHDRFITAGRAWQMCRQEGADPAAFGIFDMSGLGFIIGNLLRDVAALNKVEMLPWDGWGLLLSEESDESAEALAWFDRLAALAENVDANFDELRALYDADERLRVGPVFKSALWGIDAPDFDVELASLTGIELN